LKLPFLLFEKNKTLDFTGQVCYSVYVGGEVCFSLTNNEACERAKRRTKDVQESKR
jgi:hypothetical protein